jgi:Nucleotidyl transferase AbiEii toxin, Type IV TA system
MTRLVGSSDFGGLVEACATARGIPAADIEKDVWVVEALRSVFRPLDRTAVVFKGGTSLSKAYGIIERFSEDVDLLVVPDAGLGRKACERILKILPARAAADMGTTTLREGSRQTGVHRAERVAYEALYPDPGRVTAGVLLELGVRGGPEPAEIRTIRSYAADWAIATGVAQENEYDEFLPVEVLALRPERTLIEKLGLIHRLAVAYPESTDKVPPSGRHLYDIFRLLGDASVLNALGDTAFAERIAADAHQRGVAAGWPSIPRPRGGFATSPAFVEGTDAAQAFSRALDQAATLVWGDRPTFGDVQARVREHARLL